MKTIAERLQYLIDTKNFSVTQCAKVCGMNRSQIYQILNGEVQKPQLPTLKKIIEGFNCDPTWLKTGARDPFPENAGATSRIGLKEKGSRLADLVKIPVLGKVPAGIPSLTEEQIDEYITLPGTPPNCYALKVEGHSMEPEIKPDDYVLFVINQDAKSGDVVVVNDEFGDSMIKRLKIRNGEYFLVPDNPAYPTYQPNGEYRIMGVVIGGWRPLKI